MDRYQMTRKVAVLGIAANILLLVLKLFVGFISRSQAMIADGFNSAGDVFASTMTYVGNKIASKPEDQDHPYGHGKAEYIFSMIISLSLLLVAYLIFRDSLDAIMHKATFTFSWQLITVAIITIALKSFLFVYTKNAGKRENNLLILANSEDHRNDIFVTSSTLVGIILGINGIYWFDGVVGIGISLWIAYTAFKIFSSSYYVLMDTSIDKVLKEDVIKTIESVEGVEHVDSVTAKPIGIDFIVIIKVSICGEMTVNESHRIAGRIKEKVKGCRNVGDVVVHINPA
ncbi:MAG: cation diffusion facilitator family transporter [Clostridiales bacterium]|nr:cation diffusion facilitator family transporter [Clostridiales bacterium]